MEIITSTVLVIVAAFCGETYSTKCIGLAPAVEKGACDAIDAVDAVSALEPSDLLTCALGYKNKSMCVANNCCWFKGECYQKPRKCYSDFRNELCPRRLNFRPNSIYAGFSLNGTHCFIDTIKVHLQRQFYGAATSLKGVRILDQNEDPCVTKTKTKASRTDSGKCNVTMLTEGVTSTGNSYANKCVVEGNSGTMLVFDFGLHDTCLCSIDAWLEEENDQTGISDDIREIVEQEESKSSCSRILGRILRRSWRSRINIVNKDEADVVVRTLLNVTERRVNIQDAEILLDTSSQISRYKFYEGLDNRSVDMLIKSSTKFDSNLLRNFVARVESNGDSSQRPKRSADIQESPSSTSNTTQIQWKIMKNLEEIAENIASLIEIPENATNYVVRATEEVIDLRVVIAKSDNLSILAGTGEDEDPAVNSQWSASITNITAPAQGGGVAIVTAFYNVTQNQMDKMSNKTRESGVLAINPRVVSMGVVDKNISLPVTFTLPISKSTHDPTWRLYVCAYHGENNTQFGSNWLDSGCHVTNTTDDFVTCECTHTTHFAVLMQLHYDEVTEKHLVAWEYLSIVMGTLSVAALSITIIVFITYRKILMTHRTAIHLHLAISLLGGYSSFLLGSIFSSGHLGHPNACFAFAILAHLFFLSSFVWFLMEGVYLFYKVVMVFSTKLGECSAKYAPFMGWGFPTLAVVVTVVASRKLDRDHDGEMYDPYYDQETCFLQTANGIHWAFLGPALCIIAINICILIKVVTVIFQSSRSSSATKNKTMSDSVRASAKGAIILLPILGIPWILNLFSSLPPPAGIVAGYAHIVLMGLQGIAIFLFYCVFNSEVRKAIKLTTDRRKSVASIEVASKNRKRSQTPLIDSNLSGGSPPNARHKESLSLYNTGRTYTGTSQISYYSNSPSSPNYRKEGSNNLSPMAPLPEATSTDT